MGWVLKPPLQSTLRLFALFAICVLLAAALEPAIAQPAEAIVSRSAEPAPALLTPATASALAVVAQTRAAVNQQQNNKIDVAALQNATTVANRIDTDGDGLYDPVEAVLGTDVNDPDTDFDRLSDYDELFIYFTDPLKPDSNDDGLPDYFEVTNVSSWDLDGDGFPNAWDFDNDGDGVIDAMDMSPFSFTNLSDSFRFEIKTTGNVTYLNFQLRPKDAYLLYMAGQTWDWRDKDSRGNIKDLDDSKADIHVTPLLELTLNSVPDQSAVRDYGISISLNKALVPLSPDQDYGSPVALRGRMFYPAPAPLAISADARLIWMISGASDEQRDSIALQAQNGLYVRASNGSNGTLVADSSIIGEWENLTLREVSEDTIALKAQNGLYVRAETERGGALMAKSTAVGDWETFELVEVAPDSVAFQAHNGRYVRLDPVNGTLIADSSTIGAWETFVRLDQGKTVDSDTITFGHYYEDFMLTGFSVEECAGSDAGLFYSADKNETLEAGFVLAYDFLRNATNRVTDMPPDLIAHNVTVNTTIRTFTHQDEALMEIASNMTPAALQALPEGLFLPVLAAFEDRFTRKDMDDLPAASATTFELDLRSEPQITTKTVKMSWYNTSSDESLETESIVTEMQDWGHAQSVGTDNLAALMSVVLAWNVGETRVTRTGWEVPAELEYPEGLDVVNDIKDYGLIDGLQFITQSISSFGKAYYFIKFMRIEATATAGSSSFKLARASMKTLAKTQTGFLKAVKRVTNALEALGWIVEIGLALYSFFAMAISSGWSGFGIFVGTLYAVLSIIFAVLLYAISCIPLVGQILAALIMLSDILTMLFFGQGWMEMLIGWIIDLFTDVRVRSEVVGLDMKDSSVKIEDTDNNGLDVGDWIEFRSIITGTVKRTGHGNLGDVLQSYVKPSYRLGFSVGDYTGYSNLTRSWNNGTHKEETYDVGVKLWPNSGVNLPMLVQLTADYKTFYDNCWWLFGWHCDRESQTGRSTSNLDTLYFDVFPATISEFVRWRGISPLESDYDHDGLTDAEERRYGTSPWSFDTDGDGLSDKYELDIGTDPRDADMDRDGLSDRVELLYSTDPFFWDTDGDGLSDYMEVNGWVITVNYSGYVFNTTVHSDPLRPDSDGDGVGDEMEYFSFLNPLAKDTDGDGVMDVASPKYYTQFAFTTTWGSYGNETGKFTYPPARIAVDNDGYVYVAEIQGEGPEAPPRIQKFDANGTFLTQWYVNDMRAMTVGNGYVYAVTGWPNSSIMKFDTNGTFLQSWVPPVMTPSGVAVDQEGNVYVYEGEVRTITICDPDGTFITTWSTSPVSVNDLAVDSRGSIYTIGSTGWGARHLITKYDFNGTVLASWGGAGSEDGNFSWPQGLAVDSGSFVYVADTLNHRIQKFAPDGFFIKRLGYEGEGDGAFKWPRDVAVWAPTRLRIAQSLNLGNTGTFGYIGDLYVADSGNDRIQKFAMEGLMPNASKDSDGDGLTDLNETLGWDVTFTNATGTYTIQVSSEPLMADTDLDGLTDYGEFIHRANPRDVDTDDDGLTDLVEYVLGTNILHYDTDGDGLDDGTEVTFGSDPLLTDTDSAGLTDYEEFYLAIHFPYYAGTNLTTDPTKPDTDDDGLTDSQEINFSDPLLPDTDGDSLLDGEEWKLGTNPWDPDNDGDGLIDGHEHFFQTNLTNPDTDNDGVNDSKEIDLRLDPLLNDTDGDGLQDGEELNLGTNPLSRDSDGDGIIDSEDFDSFTPFEEHVYLACDPDSDTAEFVEKLNASLKYTYLHIVSRDELLSNHAGAPYIVLVGRPAAANGTVGALIHELLNESGEVLTNMLESDTYRLVVRYGVWNSTQTIVMLSHPYPSDHWRVLNLLKSRTVTILSDSAQVVYRAPTTFFEIDTIDTLKQTDSVIAAALKAPVMTSIELSRYNASTIAFALNPASGLTGPDEAVNKYLEIEVSETVQNETTSNLTGARVTIYYTAADLDRTGDGDADDDDDINESTLTLYWFDEAGGRWRKLSETMDWVVGTGVSTTNIELYGNEYEGYVWADLLRVTLLGLAGGIGEYVPPPPPPNPPVDITEGSSIRIYGEDNRGPYKDYDPQGQMYYDHWSDPFKPGILQKDSITFNPAIILWDGQNAPLSANSKNIHEKKFLRIWYEPEHVYSKPAYCYPTIEVESTYMLVDKQDWTPTSGRANETFFQFPLAEIPTQTGLGAFENEEGEPHRPRVVTLADVCPGPTERWNKTTRGHIRLEKTYTVMPGETIQFLDFKLQYRYLVAKNGELYAKVKMWYAGNYEDDTEITTVLGQYSDGTANNPYGDTWFKRHLERYGSPDHANHVTWYARLEGEIMGGQMVEITVGKELMAGDTFYVNGVRYDVSAVEVINYPTGPEFTYITLRTPLPTCKDLAPGALRELLDDGKISSQWLVCLPPKTALPLNPPFNAPYTMVDDINVVLWKPLKQVEQWPVGNPSGNLDTEYFPLAERYLTMQEPPFEWLYYFRAVPIDTDKDMTGLPTDWQLWDQYGPLNRAWMVNRGVLSKWIAYDVDERLLAVATPLRVAYLDELKEPRYSTDLLEVLNEYNISKGDADKSWLEENWTKFEIETLPDQYAEFVLPALPDVLTPYRNKTGDYLITTSFFAPNSVGAEPSLVDWLTKLPRVAFAYDVDHELTPYYNRVEQLGDGLDLYVNQWGGSSTIRIYGEENRGPVPGYGAGGIANPYPGWQDPFDPTSLQKDSITFNPAIVQWDGRVYPMSAQSEDIDVKAFLRLWYEQEHNYSKSHYKRPTIETETTYMLIDKQDKIPTTGSANDTFFFFPICEDETTAIPGLELIENPNSEPDRPNVVTLANVYGVAATAYNKTTDGKVWLQKTYRLDKGDKVQFLDHKLTFVGIVLHNRSYYAKVKVDYAGNRDDDTGTALVLATFDGGATYDPDPHRITWFKRHSETFRTSAHPHTTWYARLENYDPNYGWAEITVGKELQAGDVFYADGVRYDIPAIEVLDITGDTDCEKFTYITIRTPFPKCIQTGVTSVPDEGIISSQWLECIAPYEPFPVLPPFNMLHTLVDDIDVVLWKPLKHTDKWPLGDPIGTVGLEYFPCAERYLTMQYPPAEWLYYFRAVPVDTDNDLKMPTDWALWDHQGGPFYPGADFPPYGDVCKCTKTLYPPTPGNYTIFDPNGWIALDMAERIIPEPYDPLVISYVDELIEPRYSTNLLQILNETGEGTANLSEQWGTYEIQTFPDLYTEFLLPKDEAHAGMFLMNDYLITTSFLAPNSEDFSDLVDRTYPYPRMAFVFDAFDSLAKTGLYVNELVQTPPDPENKAPVLVIAVAPGVVNALETVTVATAGTSDDRYPLVIECNWKDGTAESKVMASAPAAPQFTHQYLKSGVYAVTVKATDVYGASDVKTAPVSVTSDGAVLSFNYGWNAISAPVQESRSMSTLFVTTVPGFYAVYSWDNAAQKWAAEDLSQPLDPAKGYFIWATAPAEIELTGAAAAYSPSLAPGWNLVGIGFEPVSVMSTYAYYYDRFAATYIPTHYLDPGSGYFIWM